MAQNSLESLKNSIVRRVRAEPKKAVILAGLLSTVGFMWARLLTGASGPNAANASMTNSGELPAVPTVAPTPDSPAMRALAEWSASPIAPVSRNVFALKLEYFPQDGTKPVITPENPKDTFWDQLAKSMSAKADQEKARRILVDNLQWQAAKLELQSTVMSNGVTKALINGSLVAEGDSVAGFKLLKIEAKRVVVEREGVKLEVGFNF